MGSVERSTLAMSLSQASRFVRDVVWSACSVLAYRPPENLRFRAHEPLLSPRADDTRWKLTEKHCYGSWRDDHLHLYHSCLASITLYREEIPSLATYKTLFSLYQVLRLSLLRPLFPINPPRQQQRHHPRLQIWATSSSPSPYPYSSS